MIISIHRPKGKQTLPPTPRCVKLSSLCAIFRSFRCPSSCFRLEAEDLVLKLADGPGLGVAKRLGGLLHGTDHGRRAADEDLDIRTGAREFVL